MGIKTKPLICQALGNKNMPKAISRPETLLNITSYFFQILGKTRFVALVYNIQ